MGLRARVEEREPLRGVMGDESRAGFGVLGVFGVLGLAGDSAATEGARGSAA